MQQMKTVPESLLNVREKRSCEIATRPGTVVRVFEKSHCIMTRDKMEEALKKLKAGEQLDLTEWAWSV